MTKIHPVTKTVPAHIRSKFFEYYGPALELAFYWYRGSKEQKVWGAIAREKDGTLYGYAYQINE